MSTYIMRKGKAKLSDLQDGAASLAGYPGAYLGRVYYVDNINGSSGGDGLSWGSAFSQLSYAVTAAEAYRATLGNIYTRNVIYLAGTGTAYTAVTALPNYCDIIGVGADPRGDGTGIVVITGAADADACAGAQRGNRWYNIQFKVTADTFWCFDATNSLRSTFENCAFMHSAASASTGGGFRVTANSGGMTFKNCHFGTNGAAQHPYGIYVSAGCTFNNSWIEFCHITALTAGIYTTSTANWTNAVVRYNTISGGTSVQAVTGIAADTHATIMANYITASSDAISGATAGNTVGNEVIDNATAAREKA